MRLQQKRKNANESANADLDKTVAQRDLAFYNKFRDIPVSLFGGNSGEGVTPHSGKLERSRRDYPNEYDGLLGVIPSKKKSDE